MEALLIAAMQDRDDVLRCNAIYSLGQIGDARALEVIIRALGDSCAPVRENAKRALEAIRVDQSVLIDMLRNPASACRQYAVEKLEELGWEPDRGEAGGAYWATKQQWDKCVQIGAPAVEALIAELNVQRSIDIISALAEIGDERAIQPLINIVIRMREVSEEVSKETDIKARHAAAAALGKLGAPAIGPILEAAKVKSVKYPAREISGGTSRVEYQPYEEPVGDWLLESLSYITDVRAEEPLSAILAENKLDALGQKYAVRALGEIGGARAVESLLSALQNSYESVADEAARALGKIGDTRAVEPLISVLERLKVKGSPYLSCSILAKALGQIGDRRACAPILEALFQSIEVEGYPWQDSNPLLHNLFTDYTGIITDLIGYTPRYETVEDDYDPFPQDRFFGPSHISEDHDWFRSTTIHHVLRECIVERNQKALNQLCSINTPVSSNLLHHVKNIQTQTMSEACRQASFDVLRRRAEEELIRRGNPPYDPSVYLNAAAWKMPEYNAIPSERLPEYLCPECGSPVSTSAMRCRKCGHKFA